MINFNDTGLSFTWFEQRAENSIWLSKTVQNILELQYKQYWQGNMEISSKCSNYKIYKTDHKLETYLTVLAPRQIQTAL